MPRDEIVLTAVGGAWAEAVSLYSIRATFGNQEAVY